MFVSRQTPTLASFLQPIKPSVFIRCQINRFSLTLHAVSKIFPSYRPKRPKTSTPPSDSLPYVSKIVSNFWSRIPQILGIFQPSSSQTIPTFTKISTQPSLLSKISPFLPPLVSNISTQEISAHPRLISWPQKYPIANIILCKETR